MFNANSYETKLNDTVDSDSDKFAYFFDQLSLHEKAALMKKLGDFAETPDAFKSFINGTYAQAQASDGAPAKAIGAGASVSSNSNASDLQLSDKERQLVLGMRNMHVTDGQLSAINKIGMGIVPVDKNGNFTDIADLKAQLENQQQAAKSEDEKVKADLAKVKKELEDEQKKSKAATSDSSTPSSNVDKAKLQEALDKAKQASEGVKNQSGRAWGKATDHVADLKAALDEMGSLIK